jgi:hypothetical protein
MKEVDWSKVDLTKIRRRIEDRLRKDEMAVKLTAILLKIDLKSQVKGDE